MQENFINRIASLEGKTYNMTSHAITVMGANSLHMTNIMTECNKLEMYIEANSNSDIHKLAIIGRRLDFLEKYFTLLEKANDIGMMP